MIIIVEGIDRVGKTTICNKLAEELGIPVYKHNNKYFDYKKMDNDNETDKMLQLLDLYSMTGGNIIFDRFMWSDYVYGCIERKYNVAKASKNLSMIEKRLSELNAMIILVLPEDINRSNKEHGKDLSLYEVKFESLYKTMPVRCTKIKTSYNKIDKTIEKIKEKINEGRI